MANFIVRSEPAIIGVLFFLAPFVTLVAPMATAPVIILFAGVSIGVALIHGQTLAELFRFDRGLALFAVVTAYLLINASWSLDVPRALNKVLWFGLVVAMTFAASRALCRWNERQIRIAVTAFLVGMTAGLMFIAYELATRQDFMRHLYNWLPATRPSFKTLRFEGEKVVAIAAFELNRNVAVMLLMLWPALLCLSRLTDGRRRALALGALFVATAAVVFCSQHETSKLGLVTGAIVFVTARRWPRAVRIGMLTFWCVAFVVVVPLATEVAKDGLQQVPWLPYSARSRITMWAYTAQKVPEAPLLGIGLNSTRTQSADRSLPRREEPLAEGKSGGPTLAWRTGPHSHNEFLQTWYELGAVGAILLLAAGCAVILIIGGLPPALQPFMLAQFAGFFATAAFSWGMWQSWLMALTGLAAFYGAMAVRFSGGALAVADTLARAARPLLASPERAA